MPLQPRTFEQLQALAAQQYSAEAQLPANTDPGSSLGAIFNAISLLALVVQQEIVYVDQISRLNSIPVLPNGQPNPDVDSFCEPFGVPRTGPVAAGGPVNCSSQSPVSALTVVQVDKILTTQNGLQFIVIADDSNPDYSAGDGGYPIAIGQRTTQASVECLVEGTIGNVQIGQISEAFSSIPGVSIFSNPVAFTNGVDFEPDQDYKQRFTLTVSSGRVATRNAIAAAIEAVQTFLTYSLGDQKDAAGNFKIAYFTVFVNEIGQSSGPGETLLTAVYDAVDAVRSAGISFQVLAPTLIQVDAAATIVLAPGASAGPTLAACTAAFDVMMNNVGLDPQGGNTYASIGKVYAALLGVDGVFDVQNLLLNGAAVDVVATFGQQLVAGATTFTT